MKKKKTLTIALGLILLLSVITVTYAYFASAVNNNNPERISVGTGEVVLTLNNGSGDIAQLLDINGTPIEYRFSLSYNGKETTYVKLNFVDLINTYTEGSLVYKLYESSDGLTYSTTPILTNNVPVSLTASTKKLGDGIELQADNNRNKVMYYKLTVEFVDLPDVEQIIDASTQFYTRFGIEVEQHEYLADYITYSNVNTTCTTIECSLNELYNEL